MSGFPAFVRLAIGVCALCLLALGGAAGLGAVFDRPPDSVMGRNPCRLPCAFGVTPGISSRADAEQTYGGMAIRSPLFLTARRYSYTLNIGGMDDAGEVVAVSPSLSVAAANAARLPPSVGLNEAVLALLFFDQASGGGIESVSLFTVDDAQQFWRLGDLLAEAGAPDRVAAACGTVGEVLLLIYDAGIVAQIAYAPRLTPEMEVARLSVTVDADAWVEALGTRFCTARDRWIGFVPYAAYGKPERRPLP